MPKTDKQIIGDLGEGIICNYLKDKGFEIIERNYWKPWGEIDVITQKRGIIHFVEVKTVTRENLDFVTHETKREENNVPHETLSCENNVSCGTKESVQHEKNLKKVRRIRDLNRYRPEDNLHPWKLKRLSRVIQTYLVEKDKKNVSYETNWQFDVAIVYLNKESREVKTDYLEDIIL